MLENAGEHFAPHLPVPVPSRDRHSRIFLAFIHALRPKMQVRQFHPTSDKPSLLGLLRWQNVHPNSSRRAPFSRVLLRGPDIVPLPPKVLEVNSIIGPALSTALFIIASRASSSECNTVEPGKTE